MGRGSRGPDSAGGRAAAAACAALAALASAAVPLDAQLGFGLQASSGEVSDFGLGPRATLELGPLGVRLAGSLEVFFPSDFAIEGAEPGVEGDVDFWEANLNLHWVLGLPLLPIAPYLGGGLNVRGLKISDTPAGTFDEQRTDQGVNALAGIELRVAGVSPFVEFRYELGGGEQWVVSGGIVF